MKPEYEIHPKKSRNFTIKRNNTNCSIDYIKTQIRTQEKMFDNSEFTWVFNEEHGIKLNFKYQKPKLSLEIEKMDGV